MNIPPDKQTIELIARELATEEAFIEKDWYAVQVLAAVARFTAPGYELIFSGGTALAKAHKLIERFSEDVDFVQIPPQLYKCPTATHQLTAHI